MTLQAWLAAITALVMGVGILVIASAVDWVASNPGLQGVLNNVGGAVIASVALIVLWELRGKRSFSREILETAQYAADIESSGVTRIGTNYLKDPDWDALFADVEKLDIFFAYGRTWRNSNLDNLREIASKKRGRLRVFLPDPSHNETIAVLAERFGMDPAQLVTNIEEAKNEFSGIHNAKGAEVEVYYREGDALFSCYRFDNTAVITLYAHQKKRVQVPTIICKNGGQLYDFVRAELKAIQEQSVRIYPTSADGPAEGVKQT